MLQPTLPTSLLPLTARGGRAFRVDGGDRVLTLPGAGPTVVAVPRGHGAPVLADARGGSLRALATGLACTPVRWASAGAVAAWLREAPAVRPGAALGPVALQAGGVTVVRVRQLTATVARLGDGAAAVVVRGPRVVALNARAAARGIRVGMPRGRAEARCPALLVHEAGAEAERLEALGAWLAAEYGPCTRVRGGFVVHGAPELGPQGLGALVQLRVRVWQATGLVVSAVAAPDAGSARRLSALLGGAWVAAIPADAAALWSARPPVGPAHRAAAGGRWEGAPMLDVEGVVTLAQALTVGARGAVALRLWTDRGRIELPLDVPADAGRAEVASRVEGAVRRALGGGVAVWAMRWHAVGPARRAAIPAALPRQVALWA